MNPLQLIATLRKFGNYLAGVFPLVAKIADWLAHVFDSRFARLSQSSRWQAFVQKPGVAGAWKVVERFYWKDYGKDRLAFEDSPADIALRSVFQLCALLCLLIPVTQIPLWQVAVETFSGFRGSMPGWSTCLCMLGLSCAWAALLVGTAVSNRIVFAVTAISASYFLTTCVVLLPRDYSNLLLTGAILLSLFFCERNQPYAGKPARWLSAVNVLTVGVAAGIQMFALTPLKPLVASCTGLNSPLVTLAAGALIGIFFGTICFLAARAARRNDGGVATTSSDKEFGATVRVIAALVAAYLLVASLRSSLGQEAGMLISSVGLTNSYLWPVWYFVGVGIIHKFIGSSRAVANGVESLLPGWLVTPLLVSVLVVTTLACVSDSACLYFATLAGPAAEAAFQFFAALYQYSKPWLWTNPLDSVAAHWLSKVFLFDVLVVVVLAVQRKLTSQALIRLLYLTSLAAFLVWEYLCQLSSFSRSQMHSVLALFFFSAWLLWLMHTVGWSLCHRSSPNWPSRGRLAIYVGLVSLALIEIHSRASAKDFKVVNELFLTMFRGAIDIGLPYFLFTWASRRLTGLPVTSPIMLGVFVIGALVSFVFNILNKVAISQWSTVNFVQLIDQQAKGLMSSGSINVDLLIPMFGLWDRALVYGALLVFVHTVANRLLQSPLSNRAQALVFILMSFASGVASFSLTLVDLPLSALLRGLTAPLIQETQFNSNVFMTYLAYWIPALLLAYTQLISVQFSRRKRAAFMLCSVLFGVGFNVLSFSLFQYHEALLRATETLYSLVSLLACVFAVLLVATLKELVDANPSERDEGPVLLSFRSLIGIMTVLLTGLGMLVAFPSVAPSSDRPVPMLGHSVILRDEWSLVRHDTPPANATGPVEAAVFKKSNAVGIASILQVGTLPSHPDGVRALLKQLVGEASRSGVYRNLSVNTVQSWNKFRTNALACYFSYELLNGRKVVPMSGLTVLVPADGGRTEYYTLYASPGEMERDQWQIASALEALQYSNCVVKANLSR